MFVLCKLKLLEVLFIIDDHSKKVWVFALKSKNQEPDVFKEFHVSVKRETDRKLKYVRANNGGEYKGPFENYYRF